MEEQANGVEYNDVLLYFRDHKGELPVVIVATVGSSQSEREKVNRGIGE